MPARPSVNWCLEPHGAHRGSSTRRSCHRSWGPMGRRPNVLAVSICSAKPDGGVLPPDLDSRRDRRDRPRPRRHRLGRRSPLVPRGLRRGDPRRPTACHDPARDGVRRRRLRRAGGTRRRAGGPHRRGGGDRARSGAARRGSGPRRPAGDAAGRPRPPGAHRRAGAEARRARGPGRARRAHHRDGTRTRRRAPRPRRGRDQLGRARRGHHQRAPRCRWPASPAQSPGTPATATSMHRSTGSSAPRRGSETRSAAARRSPGSATRRCSRRWTESCEASRTTTYRLWPGRRSSRWIRAGGSMRCGASASGRAGSRRASSQRCKPGSGAFDPDPPRASTCLASRFR